MGQGCLVNEWWAIAFSLPPPVPILTGKSVGRRWSRFSLVLRARHQMVVLQPALGAGNPLMGTLSTSTHPFADTQCTHRRKLLSN